MNEMIETDRTCRGDVEARIRASLENLVFALGEATGADRSSLFVVDEERAELRLALTRNEEIRDLAVRLPRGRGVAGLAWERGRPVRVEDAYACPRFEPDVDGQSGYRTRSLLCVPVRGRGGRVAAILELLNPIDREAFTPDDERAVGAHEQELSVLLEACGAIGFHPRVDPSVAHPGFESAAP
jgi:adenylate cyclase